MSKPGSSDEDVGSYEDPGHCDHLEVGVWTTIFVNVLWKSLHIPVSIHKKAVSWFGASMSFSLSCHHPLGMTLGFLSILFGTS